MELRNILTFMKVAELKNFSEAARQLGYSQAAVTIQIKQLEGELGVPLFERIGKNVRLTYFGDEFIPKALDVLNSVRAAKSLSQTPESPAGKLRLCTGESLLISVLPPVITEFGKLCPKVELSTKTALVSELFDMIRKNEADLLYFLDKKTDFPEWVKVMERREYAFFVASSKNHLASRKNIPLSEILDEPLLLTEEGISYRYFMEQALASRGLAVHPILETGNTDVITKMLLNNAGISFLPEFVVRNYINSGLLCRLDTDFPEIDMYSQLIYHRDKWVTPQMKIFIDLLKENKKQTPKLT